MFTYVSGANFFGEIVEWSGFALACWSLPSLAFATFTALNIGPRAIQHHRYLMNFSAQKFNNLVYACMHAPSCIRKRKILRSHVTCKYSQRLLKLKSTSYMNWWIIQEGKDKVDHGDDLPFGLASSFCNTKLFSLLFVCWFYFIPKCFCFAL